MLCWSLRVASLQAPLSHSGSVLGCTDDLVLSGNALTGTIPAEVVSSINMCEYSTNGNSDVLSSTHSRLLPSAPSVGRMTVKLSLFDNSLTGTIPATIASSVYLSTCASRHYVVPIIMYNSLFSDLVSL